MRVDSELRKNHPAQMAWAAIAKEYRQAELRRDIEDWFKRQRGDRD
jgi:hypothetical protein